MPAFLPFSLPSPAFSPQMLLHGISSMPVLPCPFCLHKPLVQCPVDGSIAHQLLSPLQLDSLCDLLGRPLLLGQQTNDQVFEFSFLQKFFLRQRFRRRSYFFCASEGRYFWLVPFLFSSRLIVDTERPVCLAISLKLFPASLFSHILSRSLMVRCW